MFTFPSEGTYSISGSTGGCSYELIYKVGRNWLGGGSYMCKPENQHYYKHRENLVII